MRKPWVKNMPEPKPQSEIVLYQTEDGRTRLEVRLENETVWWTQAQMAELFQTTKQNVSLHIQNVFTEKELREDSVVKESLTTASDGRNYQTKFYNLDVIIAKNYLNEEEMGLLNLIVTQYLDFAEFQARTRRVIYMHTCIHARVGKEA